MTILQQAQPAVKPQIIEADGLDLAFQWGHEDALEGNDRRGSQYFPFGAPAHGAYNEGYDAGQAQRERSQVLATLATAQVMPTDFAEALAEVEANGIRYVSRGIDWAAVEDSGVGM